MHECTARPTLTWWEGKTEHGLGEGDARHQSIRPTRGGAHPGGPRTAFEPTSSAHLARHGASSRPGSGSHRSVERRRSSRTVWSSEGDPPGTGAPERTGALRMAQPRPCRDGRRPCAVQARTPPFDYFHINSIKICDNNTFPRLRPRRLGDLEGDRGSGEHHLAAQVGGGARFAMGPGHGLRLAARCPTSRCHRSAGQPVRRRRRTAGPHSSRKAPVLGARHEADAGEASTGRCAHQRPALTQALGSTQLLPNGNVLVGWGPHPWLSEYTHGGELVFDAHLPFGGQNYRVLKMPWHGRPHRPAGDRSAPQPGSPLCLASWNGATDVRAWRFETGRPLPPCRRRRRPAGRGSRPSSRHRPTRGTRRSSRSTPTANRSAARRTVKFS